MANFTFVDFGDFNVWIREISWSNSVDFTVPVFDSRNSARLGGRFYGRVCVQEDLLLRGPFSKSSSLGNVTCLRHWRDDSVNMRH